MPNRRRPVTASSKSVRQKAGRVTRPEQVEKPLDLPKTSCLYSVGRQDATERFQKGPNDPAAPSTKVPEAAPPPAWGVLDELKRLDQVIADKRAELQDLEAKAAALRAKLKEGGAANPYGRGPAVAPPRGTEDVEKKLDRLQKELEELRRELRKGQPATLTVPAPATKPPPDAPLVPLTPLPASGPAPTGSAPVPKRP